MRLHYYDSSMDAKLHFYVEKTRLGQMSRQNLHLYFRCHIAMTQQGVHCYRMKQSMKILQLLKIIQIFF